MLSIGQIVGLVIFTILVILAIVKRDVIRAARESVRKFLREVREEMRRVAWPSRDDIIGDTVVVLVAVIVLTLVVTAWDRVLSLVVRLILGREGV